MALVLSLLSAGLLTPGTSVSFFLVRLNLRCIQVCNTCLLNTWIYKINISYTFKMEAKIILSKKRSSILDLKGLNICIQEENITTERYGTQCLKDTVVLFVNWWTWGMGCIWNTISRMCACFLHTHEVVFNLGVMYLLRKTNAQST